MSRITLVKIPGVSDFLCSENNLNMVLIIDHIVRKTVVYIQKNIDMCDADQSWYMYNHIFSLYYENLPMQYTEIFFQL